MVDSVEFLLEAKLAADIDEFLLFDINEIFSADEISECLQTAILYSKEYRDVHTELRLKMGDDYKNDYPDYNNVAENLRNYIKKAKRKSRKERERVELEKKEEARLEESREKREREVFPECECEFYMAKLKRKMITVDWGLMNNSQEIYSGTNGFETSLNEWYTLNRG